MTKLSKTMRDVLRVLEKQGEYLHYMPYRGSFNQNPYYFAHKGSHGRIRQTTVAALKSRGLVEYFDIRLGRDHKTRITKAGRDALATMEGE
jgi:hypothetical protein